MLRVILEGRDAPLYHGTTFLGAYLILSTNVIKSNKADFEKAVSFTRDKNVKYGSVTLTIDQKALSSNYKIRPFSRSVADDKSDSLSEERVTQDIKNARRYITGISMTSDLKYRVAKKQIAKSTGQDLIDPNSKSKVRGLYGMCELAKQYSIPISPEIQELYQLILDKVDNQ